MLGRDVAVTVAVRRRLVPPCLEIETGSGRLDTSAESGHSARRARQRFFTL
jgi:hypothetical protein